VYGGSKSLMQKRQQNPITKSNLEGGIINLITLCKLLLYSKAQEHEDACRLLNTIIENVMCSSLSLF
jgi:hypothetical protein